MEALLLEKHLPRSRSDAGFLWLTELMPMQLFVAGEYKFILQSWHQLVALSARSGLQNKY